MREHFVYIMTNLSRTTRHIGLTNNLVRRVYERKMKLVAGFTKRYNLDCLVLFESTDDITAAIAREKELKGWVRRKKVALVHSLNPTWEDLSKEWLEV